MCIRDSAPAARWRRRGGAAGGVVGSPRAGRTRSRPVVPPTRPALARADAVIALAITVERPALTVEASLELPGTGVSALIGRSGAGKSTLLHAIAGLVRPSAGHIRVGEH